MKLSKLDSTFLKSKIARRIFFLFIGCALLPLTVLTSLTFIHVTKQIKIQSLERLQQSAKTHGLSIYERFLSMESDMQFMAITLMQNKTQQSFSAFFDTLFHERLSQRYEALFLLKDGADPQRLFGNAPFTLELTGDLLARNGKNKILAKKQKTGLAEMYLVVPLDTFTPHKSVLIARINTTYLWGIGYENILPPMTELCILDHGRDILASSFPTSPQLLQELAFRTGGGKERRFEYTADDENPFLVSFWPLYLQGRFNAPNLTVVLRQARADVLAPLQDFKIIFPLVVLLSLWIVLLLSMVFIRRYMVPVEKLKEATVQIAERNFTQELDIQSGDEFETLAHSFNTMGRRLDSQFNTLETISDISRTILSSLSTSRIIETALSRLSQFLHSEASQLILFKDQQSSQASAFTYSGEAQLSREEEIVDISHAEKMPLVKKPHLLRTDHASSPRYLTTFFGKPLPTILQLPLVNNGELRGMINLSFNPQRALSDDDCNHARQLADQITIALENANLIETLEKLNWGALQALARTVDAKSPWTAGHSERVTDLAIKIAKIMGCTKKEISALHQAALVHDIGKIAIPSTILDKPGKLTDEEFEHVKNHPLIGARILQPISGFAEAMNIVLQHHERCDGSGYPLGLNGEAISLGAKIIAVADTYDALISERPYRDGWVQDRVFELLQTESEGKLDPQVVKACLFAVQQ